VLEHQAEQADRKSRNDHEPGQTLDVVFYSATDERPKEPSDDSRPFARIEQQQRDRVRQVEPDDKSEVRALWLRLLVNEGRLTPTDPRRYEHGVAEARDREDFEETLH
jgi:hypothetical protein